MNLGKKIPISSVLTHNKKIIFKSRSGNRTIYRKRLELILSIPGYTLGAQSSVFKPSFYVYGQIGLGLKKFQDPPRPP